MIKKAAALAFASTTLSSLTNRVMAHEEAMDEKLKGNINHSVCAWCYNDIPLEELCKASRTAVIVSVADTNVCSVKSTVFVPSVSISAISCEIVYVKPSSITGGSRLMFTACFGAGRSGR